MGLCFHRRLLQKSRRFSLRWLPKEPSERVQFSREPDDLVFWETVESVLKYWPHCVCSLVFLNLLPLITGSCVGIPRYGDMRVMMAYELFSMWQNLGRSFLLICPFHILHSQIKSGKTHSFPQVLGMLIQTQEIFTCL